MSKQTYQQNQSHSPDYFTSKDAYQNGGSEGQSGNQNEYSQGSNKGNHPQGDFGGGQSRGPVSHQKEEILVHDLVKTAVMGVQAIDVVEEYIRDPEFKSLAVSHKDTYQHFANRISQYMREYGIKEDFFASVEEAIQKGMIKMSAMGSDSDSVIAEKLIKGTNMGIDTVTKAVNSPWGISSELVDLTKELQTFMLDTLPALRARL